MVFKWLNLWKQSEPPPAYWQAYARAFARPIAPDTPIPELSFVVFDTETTGLDVGSDQILSIGAVRVRKGEIHVAGSLELYLHQVYQPVKSNVEVHGILPVEREDSVEEKAAIRQFLQYIGRDVLVGHHVRFDLAMVNAVLRDMTGKKLLNPALDTRLLAQRLRPRHVHHPSGELGLDHLCRQYGIPLNDRHTAAGDAYLTAVLLLKLLARLERRGVHTWRQLQRRR